MLDSLPETLWPETSLFKPSLLEQLLFALKKRVEPGLVQMKTFEMDGALLSAGTSRSMMETKN